MTNLVLLSIQLVTNDVSYTKPGTSFINTNRNGFCCIEVFNPDKHFPKKEVWQLYTLGYQGMSQVKTPIDGVVYVTKFFEPVGPSIPMLTISNLFGTLEPKQEANWVFTPAKP